MLLLGAMFASAQPRVELTPPERLAVGDRAGVRLTLSVPRDVPVLITPRAEGTAIEVVRGRLLREDAEDPRAESLAFRIPIVAKEAGVGVLRVTITTPRCEGERCYGEQLEGSLTLRVSPP